MNTLTDKDIDQIIEGIEHFIIEDYADLVPVWQPYIDKLKALKSTALPVVAQAPEWQPIETAPKDGTSVIVFDKGHVGEAYFDEDAEGVDAYLDSDEDSELGAWLWANLSDEDESSYLTKPTLWMPLPNAPLPGSGAK